MNLPFRYSALSGAFALVLAACLHAPAAAPTSQKEPAMTTSSTGTGPTHRMPVEWPLRFKSHDFSARCYDTLGCKVIYDNFEHGDDDPTPPSASYGPDYLKGWTGSFGGIRNFPEPAKVIWRSKDGVAHEASIDMGEIFKDELIRHNVPREEVLDLTDGKYDDPPSILLEVNDRTIRVYMSAFIPTKHLQRPESKQSDYRDDVILVKTYNY
ncbi:hypothetical protein GCM10027431_22160 [Lysobacter rhizosphaerae]